MFLVRRRPLLLALIPLFLACSDDPLNPLITLEEQQWASSLNINLAAMTRLPSGVYYRDQTVGTGATVSGSPTVRVFYEGFLPNGSKFDGNVGGTAINFPLSNLIPGWQVGMQGMKVGGKRRLLIPSSLGYGPTGSGPIPPNANLVFDIELVGLS